ncbi:MAG: HAMP domain-containing histidine kinase [Proteobacteria bacterium]|nr:HAMP domain-containing histidine kinase [Pseudomonadota bacterium]
MVVHPQDPNLVYVAALGHAFGPNSERGVYRSKDGGETWKVLANRTLAIFVIVGAGVFAIYALNTRKTATRQAIVIEQTRRRHVQETNAQLLRDAESRSEFLARISHELRTPLTSLTTFAHILDSKSETLSRERIRAHSEVVSRSARQLEVLINDLLDASGSESGTFRLELADIDLPGVVSAAVADFAPQARIRDQLISIDIDIPANSIFHALADPVRIAQVVTNLVSNASKYSPPGSQIDVVCCLENESYVVKITDHGYGIKHDDLQKVSRRSSGPTTSTYGPRPGQASDSQ